MPLKVPKIEISAQSASELTLQLFLQLHPSIVDGGPFFRFLQKNLDFDKFLDSGMADIALSVSKSWLKVASNQFFIKL